MKKDSRQAFAPTAAAIRRTHRILLYGYAVALLLGVCLGVSLYLHLVTGIIMPVGAVLFSVLIGGLAAGIPASIFRIVVTAMIYSRVRASCPNCDTSIHQLGSFCPACGLLSLKPATWWRPAKCNSCKRRIRFEGRPSRARVAVRSLAGNRYAQSQIVQQSFRLRFCSSCGALLDDKGLRWIGSPHLVRQDWPEHSGSGGTD